MRNKCGLDGFCGFCYAGVKGRHTYKGHAGYRTPPKPAPFWRRHDVQKPQPVSGGASGPSLVPEHGPIGEHAGLRDYLTNGKYDDGSPRQLSTITLFWEDGAKAALNDRDNHRSLYVSGY